MNARIYALILAASPVFADAVAAATRHPPRAEDRLMYARPPGGADAPASGGAAARLGPWNREAAPAGFDPLTSSNANGS